MIPITALWLPIVLSAVIVFVASSIVHMVLGYHKSDYKRLPSEEGALDGLRKEALSPGVYVFPYCASPKEMGAPEMVEKYRKGPVGMLTVLPSAPPAMGQHLAMWFIFSLIVGVFVAYLAGRTLSAGAHYLAVFRVAGTTAFLAYGLGHMVDSIWDGRPWSATMKYIFDGLVYGLLTAGVFGWLWPR